MANTTRKIIQSSKRLQEGEDKIAQLEKEKSSLEAQIEYKKSPEYIEEIARNKLNMAKPGEEIYMYPQESGGETGKGGKQKQKREQQKKTDGSTANSKGYTKDWIKLIKDGHL